MCPYVEGYLFLCNDLTPWDTAFYLRQFDTLKLLAELKRKGRIELKVSQQEAKGREISAQMVTQAAFWVLIGICALLFLNGIRINLSHSKSPKNPAYGQLWKLERTREALQIYSLEQGGLPPKLDDLITKGVLPPQDLKFLQNSQYYLSEGGYVLESPAP